MDKGFATLSLGSLTFPAPVCAELEWPILHVQGQLARRRAEKRAAKPPLSSPPHQAVFLWGVSLFTMALKAQGATVRHLLARTLGVMNIVSLMGSQAEMSLTPCLTMDSSHSHKFQLPSTVPLKHSVFQG